MTWLERLKKIQNDSINEHTKPTEAPFVGFVSQMQGDFLEFSGPFTPYCPYRPAEEWLQLIGELDHLIERYCLAVELPDAAKAFILGTRRTQPLATIPDSLAWFRRELRALDERGETKADSAALRTLRI